MSSKFLGFQGEQRKTPPQRRSSAAGRNQKAVHVHEHEHVNDHGSGPRSRQHTDSSSILKPVCDKASEVVNVIVDLDVHVLVDVDGFEKPCPRNKSCQLVTQRARRVFVFFVSLWWICQ
jgi:hypothetical protein